MNTGIISTRYAKALLLYTDQTGGGERVCAQARQLLAGVDLDSVKLEPELERFAALLYKNGRMEDVRFILSSFVSMYYDSKGIKLAHLTAVREVSGELLDALHQMLEKQFACKVILQVDVDPKLIGGFVIEIGDKVLDASIIRQLEMMRRQFVIKCNRIV